MSTFTASSSSPSSSIPLIVPFILSLIVPFLQGVNGFSFSLTDTSLIQCGTTNITWSGGVPPFYLTVIPAYDYPANVSIPDSAWSSSTQTGSWAWTIDYPSSTNLLLAMSDSTGFAAGGISNLYNIGSSSGTNSCSMRSTKADFLFYLNETAITQCAPVEIYWDATAKLPVTILGAIPGGQAFQLQSSSSSNALVWQVNVASGTQFILSAWDKGSSGMGGTSSLLTVAGSTNNQCIDSNSPSSTTPVQSVTSSVSGGSTSTKKPGGVVTVTAIQTSPSSGSGLKTSTIVGVVVGVVLAVLVLQGMLVYFCCRRNIVTMLSNRRLERERRRRSKAGDVDLLSNYGGSDRSRTHLGEDDSHLSLSIPPTDGFDGHGSDTLQSIRSRNSIRDAPEEENSISPFLDPDGLRRVSEHSSPLPGPWDSNPDDLGRWTGAGHMHIPLPTQSPSPVDPSSRNGVGGGGAELPSDFGNPYGSGNSSRFPYPLPTNPHKRALLAAQNPDDEISPTSPFGSEFELHSPKGTRPFAPGPLAGTETYTGSSFSMGTLGGIGSGGIGGGTGALTSTNTGGTGSVPTMIGYDLVRDRGFPPTSAPRGGFRRHEDAGPIVEDLPPVYNPAWGRESERAETGSGDRSSTGRRRRSEEEIGGESGPNRRREASVGDDDVARED